MFEYVAPARFTCPAAPVTEHSDDTYDAPTTGLMNPQISITAVEASQVVGSFPLSEDFAAPVYKQIQQEQIVATPQAQVIVQEIPEVSVVERIQEQIVETIEVIPQERFQQCTIAPTMQVVTREQFHNDVEHTHLHQQCDDLEARIAILSREQSSSSSPLAIKSIEKAQVVALSRPFDGHVRRHRFTKTPGKRSISPQSSLSTLIVVQIIE